MKLWKKLGLVGVGIALSGCTSTSYAASVNGTNISSRAFMAEMASITSNKAFIKQVESSQSVFGPGGHSYSMTFVDEVLNRRISMDLVYQEARKLHITLSAEDIALGRIDAEQTFGGTSVFDQFSKPYQAQLTKDAATLDAVEAGLIHANISLSALKKYYDSNPAQFATICSSQILVGTQAQATTIYNQLKAGGNFASLAKADSGDPNTAPNGGAVGCGTYANYVSSLGSTYANIVKSLPPNKFAKPVHLSTGWAIIEVTSRTSASFDQLTPQIRAAILGSKGQSAISNYLTNVAKTSDITVSPKYGKITVSSSGVGVSPVAAPLSSKLNFFVPTAG